jgi:hypothetical protein
LSGRSAFYSALFYLCGRTIGQLATLQLKAIPGREPLLPNLSWIFRTIETNNFGVRAKHILDKTSDIQYNTMPDEKNLVIENPLYLKSNID